MDDSRSVCHYAHFMLDYAHQRAIEALKISQTAILATTGPAGLQVGEYPCEAIGLDVYLLVPRISDHLFNLENNDAVTLLTPLWEMRGKAKACAREEIDLNFLRKPDYEWSVLVQITPTRIQIRREGGWGNAETIDISPRF